MIFVRFIILMSFFYLSSPAEEQGDIVKSQGNMASVSISGVKIRNWMYQIQGLEQRGAIDKLGYTAYDMLVVEPGQNFKEEP